MLSLSVNLNFHHRQQEQDDEDEDEDDDDDDDDQEEFVSLKVVLARERSLQSEEKESNRGYQPYNQTKNKQNRPNLWDC